MIKVFNTLTRTKHALEPIDPGTIGLYVCGVTVYDFCHLGHARTYISADIIVRYLTWRGFKVRYVRNITDIDDKIIKRAQERKVSCEVITEQFIEAMQEDFARLKMLPPTLEPKATAYIEAMVALIADLIKQDHAYVALNGDVYYAVRSFADYGCLSHHNIEQLESGARVEVNDGKRDPLDFVLWKLAKPNEPHWPSPWGAGRPGWHTECVVMSTALLGDNFDLHMGGYDLIFPHHENEIAQAQGLANTQFANVWLHGGFLQIDKEKMSKSLNNFVTIRDVLSEHADETLRFLLLSSHYRSQLNYSADSLYQSKQSLARLYAALRQLPPGQWLQGTEYENAFIAAMDDDFNTPIAVSILFEIAHEINRCREQDEERAANLGMILRGLGNVLGILEVDPNLYFQSTEVDVVKIESLILAREQARQQKNWQAADALRQELSALGITIEDTAGGTTWRKN